MTRAQGRHGDRWPHGRGPQPPAVVNPYATIALAAALLGLFPVAIVFGILGFTRPGGHGMRVSALVLGLLEVAAVLGFLVWGGTADPGSVSTANGPATSTIASPPIVTTTPMAPLPPPSAAPTTTSDRDTTTDTTTTTTTTTTGSDRSSAAVGTACSKSQNGLIGTASDGSTLVCTDIGENGGGYKWSAAGPLAGGVHAPGTTCDPLVDGGLTGHTADGHAVACEGDGHNGTWQTGQ